MPLPTGLPIHKLPNGDKVTINGEYRLCKWGNFEADWDQGDLGENKPLLARATAGVVHWVAFVATFVSTFLAWYEH
jgi:hypothetical protein